MQFYVNIKNKLHWNVSVTQLIPTVRKRNYQDIFGRNPSFNDENRIYAYGKIKTLYCLCYFNNIRYDTLEMHQRAEVKPV